MAAKLQCDICGGKLIGKPGGVFECENCGTEYSTEWARAKIQEISGTVKVEGTVEVTGKVQVEGGTVQVDTSANKDALLKRAFLLLEDGDWKNADDYCEKVLDIDPENGEAYLGKLMAEMEVRKCEDLKNQPQPFDDRNNYQKAIRYGDEKLITELSDATAFVIYQYAGRALAGGHTRDLLNAARLLEKIPSYKDASALIAECRRKAEKADQFLQPFMDLLYSQRPDRRDGTQGTDLCTPLVAGRGHLTGLSVDGKAFAIGNNDYDKTIAEAWKDLIKVAEGHSHTVGLKADGTVVATSSYCSWECDVDDWEEIIDVAAGFECTVGLKRDGTVVAAGRYTDFISNKDLEYDTSSWENIVAVYAGDACCFGLKAKGTVVAVGRNGNGACDVSGWRDIVAVAADQDSEYTVGLKADGTVVATGWNRDGQCDVSGWSDIVSISARNGCTVGLKADGTVVAVGRNEDGQCNVSDWREIVSVASDVDSVYGLRKDGTVVSTGYEKISEWRNIIAIASTGGTVYGLKADGTVVAAGDNKKGQCNVSGWKLFDTFEALEQFFQSIPKRIEACRQIKKEKQEAFERVIQKLYLQPTGSVRQQAQVITGIPAVIGYADYFLCLKDDGSVMVYDYDAEEEQSFSVKNWKNIGALSKELGRDHCIAGLKKDGTVVIAGNKIEVPYDISGWRNIVAIYAGDNHAVGLKEDGTVIAAGANDYGQCNVSDWKNIIGIAADYLHTVGLKADGTAVAVGDNRYGQCNVSGWKGVTAIYAKNGRTIGLKTDGTVIAIGKNEDGQCNVSKWRDIISIVLSDEHTVGLKKDGTVEAVGPLGPASNPFDQSGQPKYKRCMVQDWKEIVSAFAGRLCTVGLKRDGTVVVAGEPYFGYEYDVSDWKGIIAVLATHDRIIGLRSDGTVITRKSGRLQNEILQTSLFDGIAAYEKQLDERCQAALESRQKLFRSFRSAQEQQKNALQTELANLKGLFTGKRRKELEERIAEADRQIAVLKEELDKLR